MVEIWLYLKALWIKRWVRSGILIPATASFLSKEEKLPYVRVAMRKVDTIKVMLMVLWEAGTLENKKYIALSEKMTAISKMLSGWSGQITKLVQESKTQPPQQKREAGEK